VSFVSLLPSKPGSVLSVVSLSYLANLDLYCQFCLSPSYQTWICTVSFVSLLLIKPGYVLSVLSLLPSKPGYVLSALSLSFLVNLDMYCQFCLFPTLQTWISTVIFVSLLPSKPGSVLSVVSLSYLANLDQYCHFCLSSS
jgi:hypothetical protein